MSRKQMLLLSPPPLVVICGGHNYCFPRLQSNVLFSEYTKNYRTDYALLNAFVFPLKSVDYWVLGLYLFVAYFYFYCCQDSTISQLYINYEHTYNNYFSTLFLSLEIILQLVMKCQKLQKLLRRTSEDKLQFVLTKFIFWKETMLP